MRAQADVLARRAVDVKGRQELRRRAADLDRDPFAPMEGSKRRVASGAGTASGNAAGGGAAMPISSPPVSPRNDSGAGITPGMSSSGANNTGNGNSLTPSGSAPLSTQLRDLLDTATLTDIRRLETSAATIGSAQALERAATALRARADWLDAQSRAMRSRARAK